MPALGNVMQIASAPVAQRGVSTLMHVGSADGLDGWDIDPQHLLVGQAISFAAALFGGLSGRPIVRNLGVASGIAIILLRRNLGHPQKAHAERMDARRAHMMQMVSGK